MTTNKKSIGALLTALLLCGTAQQSSCINPINAKDIVTTLAGSHGALISGVCTLGALLGVVIYVTCTHEKEARTTDNTIDQQSQDTEFPQQSYESLTAKFNDWIRKVENKFTAPDPSKEE
jgi:hypothetical protein